MTTRHTINIDGKTLSYLDEGQGFPILFGHSYLWNAEMWRPQINYLRKHFRCIVPDLWGHGESGCVPTTAYSIKQIADDYRMFVDKLGLEEYAIVGLSVGGMWGTQLALDDNERVRGLVIMDSFVGGEPDAPKQNYLALINQFEEIGAFTPDFIKMLLPFFLTAQSIEDNVPAVQQFCQDLLQVTPEAVKTIAVVGRGIFQRDSMLDRLSELTIPTAVIVGEHDLPRPPSEAKQMAEKLQAECFVVENAAHIANLEAPDEVNRLLEKILHDVANNIMTS